MSSDADLLDLLGRTPDPALLSATADRLPADLGRPQPIPTERRHERLVSTGAALTATSLIGGALLAVLGAATAIAGSDTIGLIGLVLGILLVATHWGWVHVAEITATRLDEGRVRELTSGRDAWLHGIAPYPRYAVTTSVDDQGAIAIERIAHTPVPVGADRFTFERTVQQREIHSGEESGVTVAERAELLRHAAAADTDRERARYEAAAEALADARMVEADEAERLAVVKASSQALSERLNARLSEPQLPE